MSERLGLARQILWAKGVERELVGLCVQEQIGVHICLHCSGPENLVHHIINARKTNATRGFMQGPMSSEPPIRLGPQHYHRHPIWELAIHGFQFGSKRLDVAIFEGFHIYIHIYIYIYIHIYIFVLSMCFRFAVPLTMHCINT